MTEAQRRKFVGLMSEEAEAQLMEICRRRQWDPVDVISRRPGSPEVGVVFDRGNGDLTTWLPSTRFQDYSAKSWVAVSVREQ